METKENYFLKLNAIKCETDKKQNLTYVSWSDAWAEVKKIYPDSNYVIYENAEWFPFWESKFGIDCKVWVTIEGIEHIVRLPVMDWANKAMKDKSYIYKVKKKDWKTWTIAEIEKTCNAATQFDINKTIQRAFAKAIAMHWIWLYVFRWEDLPEDLTDESDWNKNPDVKPVKKQVIKDKPVKWYNDFAKHEDKYHEMIANHEATPETIIESLEWEWYKLSRKTRDEILAL